MRILLVSRNFFPVGAVGGAQVSMLYLANQLVKEGHDVAVLSVDDKDTSSGPGKDDLYEYRLRLKNLYARGKAPAWKRIIWHSIDRFGRFMDSEYVRVIKEFRPDVINTNVMASTGLGIWRAAKLCDVPIVHTVHDYYLICLKSGMRQGNENCVSACTVCRMTALEPARAISRHVAEVIYVSGHMQTAHENAGLFGPATGTSIIHGAYLRDGEPEARAGFVDPGTLTIGYFGRITADKGIGDLIRALSTQMKSPWKLLVGGDGERGYVDKLKELARDFPIEFLGVCKPNDFYSRVDVVVVSSLWNDPAPRVVYEAGMHGVVPVVSSRGGLPELVKFGERGMIFDPENPSMLCERLEEIAQNPELLVQFQHRWQDAMAIFEPESVAAETLKIYERAIRSQSVDTDRRQPASLERA